MSPGFCGGREIRLCADAMGWGPVCAAEVASPAGWRVGSEEGGLAPGPWMVWWTPYTLGLNAAPSGNREACERQRPV